MFGLLAYVVLDDLAGQTEHQHPDKRVVQVRGTPTSSSPRSAHGSGCPCASRLRSAQRRSERWAASEAPAGMSCGQRSTYVAQQPPRVAANAAASSSRLCTTFSAPWRW